MQVGTYARGPHITGKVLAPPPPSLVVKVRLGVHALLSGKKEGTRMHFGSVQQAASPEEEAARGANAQLVSQRDSEVFRMRTRTRIERRGRRRRSSCRKRRRWGIFACVLVLDDAFALCRRPALRIC